MHSNTGIWKLFRANRQHQRKGRHRFSHFEDLEKRVLLAVDVGQSLDFAEPQTALQIQEQVSGSDSVTVGDVIPSRIVNGTPTSGYPSVGIVGDQWGGFCSGTLISQRHVLTAAHCAIGVDDSQGTFAAEGQTYSTLEVHVHPAYDDFFLDNDLAIYELDQDVPGIDPSPIFRGTPLVGDLLTLVGYGAGGTGNEGHNGDFGTKRVGTTPIDGVEATILTWTFDNNSESNTAPGDSGGPAFLEVDGILHLAGITSGGDQPDAGIGDHSFDTRVDVFQDWIDAIVEDTTEGGGDETGNISGVVWNDHNGDGTFDFDESGLSNWSIYLDLNQDGQLDVNEPTTMTDLHGKYVFAEIPVGTYLVAQMVEEGWEQTSPNTSTNTFVGFQRDQNSRIVNGTPTSGYPSVGIVGNQWGGFCSGTLISQRHVLTAAHCAIGVDDSQGTFAAEGQTYSTSEVHVHPAYDDFFLDNDLAIYELDQDVLGIDPSPIFRGTPLVGDLLTLVGYGAGGTGNEGHNGDFGTKRVGTTPIDGVEATILTWTFDNNSESNTAPGDSGGPAFLEVDGILHLAGITSGGDQPDAGIGDHSFDTRVDVFQDWIDAIVEDTTEGGGGEVGENLPGQLVTVAGNQTAIADFGNRQIDDGIQNGSVIWGTVWNDVNGDGLRDTTEVITVASDDVPQLISDEDLTTVVSELVIDSAAGTIADVNVVFDISHTWVDDLTVELISPAGTRVLLFDQVGLDGDDFSNTTLDDESTQSILGGTAPFTGIYQPQESLSMLAGEFAEGIWTLEVVDNWNLDGGFLNSWSLEIEMEGSLESGLEGRTVYLDLNGNGTLEEIGVEEVITVVSADVPQLISDEGRTTEVITVASDDVPQLISDEDLTTVVSELVIDSAAGTIADVNVVFDISHTWVDDLTVELISPAGTRVLLFDQVGLDGDDFSNTTLDDESTQSILDGTAPFTGIYQPQESLSMLAGEFAEGIWTLEVVDNWDLDGGFLNSWSLEIEMEGSFAESSTLVVSELVIDTTETTIADINVALDISHTWVYDLTVELISPAGTRVLLFDQVGSDGDDFSNTTLDDESSESILDGVAPFTGVYQPQEPLAMLVGEPVNGIWTLEILDSWDLDGGFLNSWSLEITTEGSLAEPSTQTDENGQYAFKDLQDDTYVVAQVLPFGWKETLPSTGNHTVSVSSAEIGAAVDFGSRLSIGAADIDALFDEIHSGNHNTSFDFTGDGLVDQQDMDELIENILGTTYGDTDLDGDVDTVDLITAINNFINASSTAIGWATGDLDGDGDVDTNDLTQLIGNFTSAKWEW